MKNVLYKIKHIFKPQNDTMINCDKFTSFEQEILSGLNPEYSWIAKDSDGNVNLFIVKPKHINGKYAPRQESSSSIPVKFNIGIDHDMFTGITYEDGPIKFRTSPLTYREQVFFKTSFKSQLDKLLYIVKYMEDEEHCTIYVVFTDIKGNDIPTNVPRFHYNPTDFVVEPEPYAGLIFGMKYTAEDLNLI